MVILSQGWPFVTGGWAAAWLVGGAAAATIPVLVHLIHTARAPRVPFPTLRFLRTAAEKTARRRRIENLLLMILRTLLFAVLALALARPYLSERFALFAGKRSGAAVIVLDNSYSMSVRHGPDTRFSKAKQEARAILNSDWRPAQAAVLLTNPGLDPVPKRLGADRAALFRNIDRAQASSGKADLAATLKAAYALLDEADAAEKHIWIVTDRQALSWEGISGLEETAKHPDIPVAVIRPTEPSFTNVAVTRAEVVSLSRVVGMPLRIQVTVQNSSPAPEKRHLLLFVDDLTQARQKRALELTAAGTPGSTRTATLTHVFEEAGPHRILVGFEGSDALAVDNTRRIAIQIADRIPVLAVKGSAAEVPFHDANFYLIRALDPGGAGEDFPWAIRPVETTIDQFNPEGLSRYAVVILNDVARPTADAARALRRYVAAGGTLVVFLGPQVDLNAYNRLLMDRTGEEGLLPARLKERIGDAVLKTAVEKVAQVEGRSPYLQELVESADLYQRVLVFEHVRTDAAGESVLARLSGGDPFLLHKRFGEGHVLLFTTTANTQWTNFPLRNLYLPLMMRIVHLAAQSPTGRRNLVAGRPFETNLYPDVQEVATVEVSGPLGPGGERVTEHTETLWLGESNRLRFEKTWNLGYYTWRVPQTDGVGGVFCTNPNGAESDLSEIADSKLRRDIDAKETHIAAGFPDLVSRFKKTARRELWQYLLTLCLLLAVVEPLVANWMRPGRRRRPARLPRGRRAP